MQRLQRHAYFPVPDMSDVKSPEKEQKEIADVKADADPVAWMDYVEHRLLTPNTGYVRWTNNEAFNATLNYIKESFPLVVPTYVHADPSQRIDQFTRSQDMLVRANGAVTLTHLTVWNGSDWEAAFVEVHTEAFRHAQDGQPHDDECWQTTCLFTDDPDSISDSEDEGDDADMEVDDAKRPQKDWSRINVVASQIMTAAGTAIRFTDMVATALRKNRVRVQEQLAALILAEKRPLTSKMGQAIRKSQLYEPQVYNLIGSFLL